MKFETVSFSTSVEGVGVSCQALDARQRRPYSNQISRGVQAAIEMANVRRVLSRFHAVPTLGQVEKKTAKCPCGSLLKINMPVSAVVITLKR